MLKTFVPYLQAMENIQHITLATAPFQSIEYVMCIKLCETYRVDLKEKFIKQSNRNRYHIAGPNGLQTLIVPLEHRQLFDTKTHLLKIDYSERWQNQHWRSLTTAYNRSPFFEFYADEIKKTIMHRFEFLSDFNNATLQFICKHFKLPLPIESDIQISQLMDLRFVSSAKNNLQTTKIELKPYLQIVKSKYDFISNLSIIDLLFNIGPHSLKG